MDVDGDSPTTRTSTSTSAVTTHHSRDEPHAAIDVLRELLALQGALAAAPPDAAQAMRDRIAGLSAFLAAALQRNMPGEPQPPVSVGASQTAPLAVEGSSGTTPAAAEADASALEAAMHEAVQDAVQSALARQRER